LIALPFAVLTSVKGVLFLDRDGVFHDNVFSAVVKVGSTTSVLILLSLGSTLSRGYSLNCNITKYRSSRTQLALVLCAKLVLMPVVGIGLFYLLYLRGVIVRPRQHRVLALVMMICYSSPTALQMFMVCSQQHSQTDNCSKILLFMYLFSPVPMAAVTVCGLLLLY
jgi:predicted permease